MKISINMTWKGELTEDDIEEFFKTVDHARDTGSKQMRMTDKTHTIVRDTILFTKNERKMNMSFQGGIITQIDGITVCIDNRRPDNEIKIY